MGGLSGGGGVSGPQQRTCTFLTKEKGLPGATSPLPPPLSQWESADGPHEGPARGPMTRPPPGCLHAAAQSPVLLHSPAEGPHTLTSLEGSGCRQSYNVCRGVSRDGASGRGSRHSEVCGGPPAAPSHQGSSRGGFLTETSHCSLSSATASGNQTSPDTPNRARAVHVGPTIGGCSGGLAGAEHPHTPIRSS